TDARRLQPLAELLRGCQDLSRLFRRIDEAHGDCEDERCPLCRLAGERQLIDLAAANVQAEIRRLLSPPPKPPAGDPRTLPPDHPFRAAWQASCGEGARLLVRGLLSHLVWARGYAHRFIEEAPAGRIDPGDPTGGPKWSDLLGDAGGASYFLSTM